MSMLDCYLKSLSELDPNTLSFDMTQPISPQIKIEDQSTPSQQTPQQQPLFEQDNQQQMAQQQMQQQQLFVSKAAMQHDPAAVAAISASAYNVNVDLPRLVVPNPSTSLDLLASAAPSALGSTIVHNGSVALTPTSMVDPSQQAFLQSPTNMQLQSPTQQNGQPGQPERKYMCPWPECGKRFMRRTDVTRHMRIHLNDRPFKCEWPECGKAFMQRSALKIHYRTHTGEKPNLCPFEGCGKAFNDTSSLARHRRTHAATHPYPCVSPGCGEKFANRKALLTHEKEVHKPQQEDEKRKAKISNPGVSNGVQMAGNQMSGILPNLSAMVPSPNAGELMGNGTSVAARRNLAARPFGLKIPPLNSPMGTTRNLQVDLDPPMSAPILSNPYARLHPYLTPPSPANGFQQISNPMGSPVTAHPMLFDAVTSPMMQNVALSANGFQLPQPMMLSSAGLASQFANSSAGMAGSNSTSPLISHINLGSPSAGAGGSQLHQLIQHQSERQRQAIMNAHNQQEAARKRATTFNVMSSLRESLLRSPTMDASGLVGVGQNVNHMSPATPNAVLQTPTSINSSMQFPNSMTTADAMMTLTSSLQEQQQQQQLNRSRADSNLSFTGSLVDAQTESVMRQLISGSPQIQVSQLHQPNTTGDASNM